MRVSLRGTWAGWGIVLVLGCSILPCTTRGLRGEDLVAAPSELRTVAEQSDYQDFGTYDQLTNFCRELAAHSPQIAWCTLGNSAEDRPIPVLVWQGGEPGELQEAQGENTLSEKSPSLAAARRAARSDSPLPLETLRRADDDQRLWVLVVGGVHGDACEGTESVLALLRDLATAPPPPWLEDLVVIAVPRWNVDGAERRGPRHRPQAPVPTHVGRRVNAQELDLDEDLLLLRAPETRALVSLLSASRPDLVLAIRTGTDRQRESHLSVSLARHPAIPDPLRTWWHQAAADSLEQTWKHEQLEVAQRGRRHAETGEFQPIEFTPRHLAEYCAVRGAAALTAEVALSLPYAERVRAGSRLLRTMLNWSSQHGPPLREIVTATREGVVQAGRNPQAAEPVPLGVAWERETNGEDAAHHQLQTMRTIHGPLAYIVPQELSRLADRLLLHGFRLYEVQEPVEVTAESYRITALEREVTSESQRAVTGRLGSWLRADVESSVQATRLEPGTYVLPLDQPLGYLAPLLLEPESELGWLADGLFEGLVDQAGDDYPIRRLSASPSSWSLAEVETVTPAERLTLDRIYGPRGRQTFGPSLPTIAWLPGEDAYLRKLESRWMRVSAATGAVEPWYEAASIAHVLTRSALLPEKVAADLSQDLGRFAPRQLSPQGDALVFSHARDLYYVRLDATEARRLTQSPSDELHPTFSPDGRRIAFIRDHNLFVVDVSTGLERQLTTEGNENHLFGELDWVYQEEVYGRGEFRGFWWSPDSRRIALLALDQTSVHRHAIADHLSIEQTLSVTPYPKAGANLPTARLAVVEAAGDELVWVELPRSGAEELLIVRVAWTPDATAVTYQVQGREQQWLELLRADPDSGRSQPLVREVSQAWVDVLDNPFWLGDGSFLWLSHRDGHARLYHQDGSPTNPMPLTPESLEIRHVHGLDAGKRFVFFTGLAGDSLVERVYRLDRESGEIDTLTMDDAFHAARFSQDCAYFLDTYSGVHQTPSMRVCRGDGTFQHSVVPQQDDDLRYLAVVPPTFHRVSARDGTLLEGLLIRPPHVDPERKYPVLCYVYGGPQAPTVRNRWGASNYLWHQMLAQQGVFVWLCDNRASSQRGIRSAWPIHGRLGEVELRDVEDGVQWLRQQPWCAPERIGMWGWSYGGYLTSYALTHSTLFRAGIAGAPVTDWHNYDAIYTERLMRMPQNNPEGYRTSSAVKAAAQLHGRLLLIHGDADDNVHLGNTLQLADALHQEQKAFELMIYPRSLHGVTQPARLRHLRDMMTDFIHRHLGSEAAHQAHSSRHTP